MPQASSIWLQEVTLLRGPAEPPLHADALIGADGTLLALGQEASQLARHQQLQPLAAASWLLAPTLVDPHSVIEQPLLGRAETLASLAAAAVQGGYGQLAILPWGDPPRDHPERLLRATSLPLQLHHWTSP